jgi:hypothetical protein
VNFGQLDAQPHDLAWMCLVEFALIYGNDWLVIPVDLQPGTLSEVRRVRYVDTFDVQHDLPRAADAFRLFEISQPGGGSLPALFLPPAALNTIEGAALEEVQFVRDETANLVWALERVVQTPGGDSRSRSSEPRADNAARRANQLGGAELRLHLRHGGSAELDPVRARVERRRVVLPAQRHTCRQ